MQAEKKDIHNRKRLFFNSLHKLENDQNIIDRNRDLILKFIRDCRLGKTLKKRQKKIIGEARCLKYIHILKKISLWLNKSFDVVKQRDMEKLIEYLENDSYLKNNKSSNSKPLSHSTKVDYKKAIRKFYKWLFGNNEHYPDLVDWIDTYDPIKEIPALKREEVEKIAASVKTRDKAIIMALFDSGARAEEFLNIKLSNLEKVDDTYKVRIVYSKTKPRTIHLPISSRYIDIWLQENKKKNDQEYLFNITYEALRRMLYRIGKKILNKRVTPHILRHSSATYYANLLNHHQLCYRYGWSMASDMPNRYLDREGIFEEESKKIVKAHDISNLEKQNQNLKEEISVIRQNNENLNSQLNEIRNSYQNIFRGKDIIKLLSSLIDNQDKMSKKIEKLTGKKFDIVLNQGKIAD